jgi:hypothetical protein
MLGRISDLPFVLIKARAQNKIISQHNLNHLSMLFIWSTHLCWSLTCQVKALFAVHQGQSTRAVMCFNQGRSDLHSVKKSGPPFSVEIAKSFIIIFNHPTKDEEQTN